MNQNQINTLVLPTRVQEIFVNTHPLTANPKDVVITTNSIYLAKHTCMHTAHLVVTFAIELYVLFDASAVTLYRLSEMT